MKKILMVLLIGTGIAMLNGCYYDEVTTFEGLPKNVSLKNDVIPIFNKNCASTGCHDALPAHSPSLVPDKAHTALTNGNYVNVNEPEKSILYLEIISGSMPPSGALSTNDQKLILGWISEGAKNN